MNIVWWHEDVIVSNDYYFFFFLFFSHSKCSVILIREKIRILILVAVKRVFLYTSYVYVDKMQFHNRRPRKLL